MNKLNEGRKKNLNKRNEKTENKLKIEKFLIKKSKIIQINSEKKLILLKSLKGKYILCDKQ